MFRDVSEERLSYTRGSIIHQKWLSPETTQVLSHQLCLTGSKSTRNFPSLLSFWLVWGSFTCLIDCQKHQQPLCLSSKDKESQSVFVHGCLASDDQRRSCASISRLLHWAATAKRVLAEDRTISFKVFDLYFCFYSTFSYWSPSAYKTTLSCYD